jgi:hypothetical protein
MGRGRLAVGLFAGLLSAAGIVPVALAEDGPCGACEEPRRGPIEIRDEFLLAQPRLTLPPASPDTLGRGRTRVRTTFLVSNTFAGDHESQGAPPDGAPFVDGETGTVDLTVFRGLADDVDVGLRVPVRWRGGGALDRFVDAFHDLAGFGAGGRDDAPRDGFRVRGTTSAGDAFSWDDGLGLGAVEVEGRWRVKDGGRGGVSAALVARLSLPTGTGPFAGGGVGAGLQVVAARRLARSLDVFAGAGATADSDDALDGLRYEPVRAHAFAALEWRPGRRVSLVLQQTFATPLTEDLGDLSRSPWYVTLGTKVDLSPCAQLEVGLVENVFHHDAAADFGVHVGLSLRL